MVTLQPIVEACEEKGLKAKVEYGEAAFYLSLIHI